MLQPANSRRTRGVTLIELMIVVVVVAILAAIAYPNYRNHVQRAKRVEAMSALLRIATEQERYYLNQNTYTTDLQDLGFGSSPFTTDSGTYRVTVTAADANTYEAEAEYLVGDDEAGKCEFFTIDATGNRGSSPNADCWTGTQ